MQSSEHGEKLDELQTYKDMNMQLNDKFPLSVCLQLPSRPDCGQEEYPVAVCINAKLKKAQNEDSLEKRGLGFSIMFLVI